MQAIPLIALALASLTACAPVASDPVCPRIVEYSPEAQTRAAAEIEALPPDSVLPGLIGDYASARAEIRECAK